jgi:hypothetical protein
MAMNVKFNTLTTVEKEGSYTCSRPHDEEVQAGGVVACGGASVHELHVDGGSLDDGGWGLLNGEDEQPLACCCGRRSRSTMAAETAGARRWWRGERFNVDGGESGGRRWSRCM